MTNVTNNKRKFLSVALICIVGAVVRIIYFLQLRASDLGGVIALDSRFYRDIALRLADGGGLPGGAISFNPIYPVFMAAVFRIFGDRIDASSPSLPKAPTAGPMNFG